jgi:RHS repeat-associated protein
VYSYLNGGLVSQYVSGGTTYFALNDHLGSTRVLTDMTPTVADALDFAPFGEQIAGGSTSSHKFTGYERDPESSLDNAQARYYSSAQGRFMSSDPFPGDIGNPQSLNRYAYVLNTPIALIDPTGMIGEGEGCEEMGTCGCDPDFGCGGGDGPDFGNWPFPSPSPIYDPPPDTSSSNPSAGDPRSQRPLLGSRVAGNQPAPSTAESSFHARIQMPSPFIIDNYTVDKNGNFVGTSYGETVCNYVSAAGCDGWVSWNGASWIPDVPLSAEQAQTLGMAGTLAHTNLKSAVANMAIGDIFGMGGAVVGDAARGPWESALFGRNGGFLNSNPWLRVGYGWFEKQGSNVFRVSGRLLNGGHFLNWPWP